MEAIIKQAQKYFEGNDKETIWATEDGNFFWGKMFAENYAFNYKKELFEVKRNEAKEETVVDSSIEKVEEKKIEAVVVETPTKEKSKPKRKRK